MKVLLVTPYFFPKNYGGAPYVYKKIIELSSNDFCVFTDDDSSIARKIRVYDKHSGIRTVRSEKLIFRIGSNNRIFNYFALVRHVLITSFNYIRCIIKTKPEFVICGQVYEVGWLCLLNRFLNLKTICYVHGEEISTIRPKGLWAKIRTLSADRIICGALGVFVVSEYTKNIVAKKFSIKGKVVVINNGVDTDNFYPVSKDPAMLRKFQIDGSFVLLSLCRLVPKKGLDLVIRSLNDIAKVNNTVRFIIGGTGPDIDRLQDLASECGVADRVIFAGFVADDDLNTFINLGDIFVMPNRSIGGDTEGFGLVFLQANACGITVVGGAAGGTSDAVLDNRSGFLVDGNNMEEFTSRVVELLKDDAKRKTLATFGLNWVRRECTWELRVKQFDQAIGDLLR